MMYTDDHWENDPFLTRNPARAGRVALEAFQVLKDLGTLPEQIADPQAREAYMAFLAGK